MPQNYLNRREVVKKIVNIRGQSSIISGLGSATYDLHSAGDNDSNFYFWGAMGGTSMTGLGLAMSKPDMPVIVITGDGEQLMGIGSLATIGAQKPKNLAVIVLDNGHFAETGMQKSHTSKGIVLTEIAKASGFKSSHLIKSENDLEKLISFLPPSEGPLFASVIIDPKTHPRSLPIFDGVEIKNRFRKSYGITPL